MTEEKRVLFGTDGIRGLANEYPMTGEMVMKLGRALGKRLRSAERKRPKVLVGKDTRLSGYLFESALATGLVASGADVHLVGPLPTPGVAFLTMGMRCDAGVMISASHNPYEDNGIKLFARDGYKLPDSEELALERLMLGGDDQLSPVESAAIGRAYRIDDAAGRYSVFAKSAFPRNLTLDGLKIVVDCANGAGYRVAPEVLNELGAEVVTIGASPNGLNINNGCGALHPEELAVVVREHGADAGLALDGDADRCILVDENGDVLDGDQILAILGQELLEQNRLPGQTVVATVMSNLGLDKALRQFGANVVRVGVGDRYVVERMRADGFALGGEQSGHVILSDFATTGDGLVTGLSVFGVMVRRGARLSELGRLMTRFPQQIVNVDVATKPPLADLRNTQACIAEIESALGDEGRVLVRYSGTQNLARVMVEGPNTDVVRTAVTRIAANLAEEVG
ncbi:MAG: phosphoglucosamine mutase [Bradymonadia bacterium]